jgi:hypothetical protein
MSVGCGRYLVGVGQVSTDHMIKSSIVESSLVPPIEDTTDKLKCDDDFSGTFKSFKTRARIKRRAFPRSGCGLLSRAGPSVLYFGAIKHRNPGGDAG